MYTNDISLNIMSLGGIALSVGMLVDNSIVVLENIVRKKEQGESILEAAQNGTSEVGSAVVASTLTTIAVFFPMVFISGIAGQLFKDQALTVTFALIFSLIVALTLIPMLASLGAGSRYDDGGDGRPANWFTRAVAFVVKLFGFVFFAIGKVLWALLWIPTWILQAFYRSIAAVYPGVLRWSLQHRPSVILVSLILFL
jgi:HAE1 family hydrophobic/amphiphilic exporter-1